MVKVVVLTSPLINQLYHSSQGADVWCHLALRVMHLQSLTRAGSVRSERGRVKGLCVEPIDLKKIVQIKLLKVTKTVSIFVCGECVRCSAVWEKVIFQLGYLVLI